MVSFSATIQLLFSITRFSLHVWKQKVHGLTNQSEELVHKENKFAGSAFQNVEEDFANDAQITPLKIKSDLKLTYYLPLGRILVTFINVTTVIAISISVILFEFNFPHTGE